MKKLAALQLARTVFLLGVFMSLIIVLVFMLFFQSNEASALDANSRLGRIFFTDGSNIYEYMLEELGLARIGEHEGSTLGGNIIMCRDHAALSYELFCLSQRLYKPAVDASLYINDRGELRIVQEQEGRKLDLGLLITELGNPGVYRQIYPLPFQAIVPNVVSEQLRQKYPDTLWAEYTTVLADIPDRTENVRVASKMLDGLFISPGEGVSFNEIVGPRDTDRGFRQAKIIVAGKFEAGLGGGVCQVSSTLYNVILLAGLEIKERHNHSVRIGYVPLGRDATVVYGHKDLVFINNTESYLLLKTSLQGLKLTMELYGNGRLHAKKISVNTKIQKTIPFSKIEVTDTSLEPGETVVLENGQPGYLTETYRIYESSTGSFEEVVSRDYYQPVAVKIAINPAINSNTGYNY